MSTSTSLSLLVHFSFMVKVSQSSREMTTGGVILSCRHTPMLLSCATKRYEPRAHPLARATQNVSQGPTHHLEPALQLLERHAAVIVDVEHAVEEADTLRKVFRRVLHSPARQ